MDGLHTRTRMLIGDEAVEKLKQPTICVVGLGGVGGVVVEALVRSGVEQFILIDNDVVSPSNLNRQLISTTETIGKLKTELLRERILLINPRATVTTHAIFYLGENEHNELIKSSDYIIDAIDTVTGKLALAQFAQENSIPIISSLGTGNKLSPEKLIITDIKKTHTCPLAKVMRKSLREKGIHSLDVVFSTEEPQAVEKGITPASMIFVPASAGLLISSYVIQKIIGRT